MIVLAYDTKSLTSRTDRTLWHTVLTLSATDALLDRFEVVIKFRYIVWVTSVFLLAAMAKEK